MKRSRLMDRQRAAACVLVFGLVFSAILDFAPQSFPAIGDDQKTQRNISAHTAELALVLVNGVQSPYCWESAPAIFVRLSFLRVISRNGGNLLRLGNDWGRSCPVGSASAIRGPPHSTLG